MHHDHGYKLLFSHREFLIDLLGAFVPEPWVGALDFSTLEKVSNSYVTDDLRSREDDIVWRVRFGSRWLYVYILLEFQSSIDRYMAVRMLSYVGLLYQDLIRQGQITNDDALPPVLPVVLYNGRKRWDAAEDIAHLIAELPPELRRYQPQLQYLLLDRVLSEPSIPDL
jgi:predicted transposase/invertase (TIGR01784 family)